MRLARRVALRLAGRRAADLLAQAHRDLDALALPDAVARRAGTPGPRRRGVRLRLVQSAMSGVLERRGETHPCLVRSLALLGEARRLGFPCRLAVGVRRDGEGLASHAWLVLDGRPFLEASESADRYVTVTVLPE